MSFNRNGFDRLLFNRLSETETSVIETINCDLERKIVVSESVSNDTNRNIILTEQILNDTNRIVRVNEQILNDTSRIINISDQLNFDTKRFVILTEQISNDTLRSIIIEGTEIVSFDTERFVNVNNILNFDSKRIITVTETINGDTLRSLIIPPTIVHFDTLRIVTVTPGISNNLNIYIDDNCTQELNIINNYFTYNLPFMTQSDEKIIKLYIKNVGDSVINNITIQRYSDNERIITYSLDNLNYSSSIIINSIALNEIVPLYIKQITNSTITSTNNPRIVLSEILFGDKTSYLKNIFYVYDEFRRR
jgi:hypothetical protein